MSFLAIKGCSTGMKLFCIISYRGCLELSFYNCYGFCTLEDSWWKLLQGNIILYFVYYGLCAVLSFPFGISIYTTVYLYSSTGLILHFMVFILMLLNFVLEVVMYVIYKKRWGFV